MAQSSSRRYVKRLWRVPKDRGALEYFATLVVKLMVKHGWPAKMKLLTGFEDGGSVSGFVVYEQGKDPGDLPPDMQEAMDIAVRIVARTYRVEFIQHFDWCDLAREYRVTEGGHFREVKK